MSRSWHRRMCEVAFLLSAGLVALYLVPLVTAVPATGVFSVSLWVALGAGATALASVLFYIFAPKQPSYWRALILYLLFTVTAGFLIHQTGGILSPFIALWMLVSFFAGVFAFYGAVPVLVAAGTFVTVEYLRGEFSIGTVAMVAFSSILPLIVGMVVWREQGEDESTRDVKNLTSRLSEVANKSEIVINAIGDGVMAVDAQGVIQLINPAAQEILGWGKQDALMLNYKSILKLVDQNNHEIDAAQDPIRQVLNNNQQVRSNDLTIVTKGGKKIQASIVVSPIGDSGAGVITVFRDITKEKAEERGQAEFVSTASHEMRTPVASIEGYLGLALNPQTAQLDDRARDFITKAHEAAQHLGRLFQDLLDVSKTEDQRLTNEPRVVDMTVFAQTVVQGLSTRAQEKGLKLTYKPLADDSQRKLAPVYFVNQDNDHIREILDNLIDNAIKYTPQGEVVVDVNGNDDKVTVSVKDTGLGIPAEDIPHLFQKFYRIDNADRQEIGGTGLGLYLSRRLAEAMNGRLWVESVHGQGSTFYFELPRLSGQEAARLKEQQELAAQQQPLMEASGSPAATPVAEAATAPLAPPEPVASAPAPVAAPSPDAAGEVKPATTVPRGESLTREQIAERVRQLESMARSQLEVPARQIPVQSEPSTPSVAEPSSGQPKA